MRRCDHCRTPLPIRARRDRRTCSTRCRVALSRARARPPAELRERPQWVRRSEAKVPLRADGGGLASSTNPSTWTTWDQARDSKVGVGLGFVLTADAGIVCLDLDGCVDGRRIAPWAQAILDRCPPTWVEVSPSGTGLHIWGRGHVGTARIIRDGDVRVECYDRGRYIALGRTLPGAPPVLADLSGVLRWLTSPTGAATVR